MKLRFCSSAAFAIVAVLLVITAGPKWIPSSKAAIPSASALTGPAVLDEWGTRFTSLGTQVGENALRTQVRITIVQMAMFDAVNAVMDGPYRPFASKPS